MNSPVRVLDIHLTQETATVSERPDLARYLGGTGLAAALYAEEIRPAADPLAPEQVVILADGPLNTIFPVSTKVVAVFRSPLTGGYGESHAGMRLGLSMRGAGYHALIIRGKSLRPTYLVIGPDGVEFKNAQAIWGLGAGETGTILRRLAPGSGHRSCIRIGPAGEKQIAFANVNVDTYRHFGRLGMGAVFGAKNLKAVVIHGGRSEPIPNSPAYQKVYDAIYNRVVHTDIMEKYHGLGTAINVVPLNAMHALPTHNLQQSSFSAADQISGETFAEKTLMRQIACSGCPIGCIHLGFFRQEFGPTYEYKYKAISYDHELIFALGSFLGMDDPDAVYALIDAVEELGLDAISAGVMLGWITEAYQNGLIREEQLLTQVSFGEVKYYRKVLQHLVDAPNEFYESLAQGTEKAARIHGGLEYCLTMGGHEMAGYHTGHGHLFGQTMGMRHSHLDNGGYAIDQLQPEQDPEKLVMALLKEEKARNVLTSLCICLFARNIYDSETVLAALAAIGIEKTADELTCLGEEIYRLKHSLRRQLGFRIEEQRFAERFFTTPATVGTLSKEKIDKMIEIYQREMAKEGPDPNQGF